MNILWFTLLTVLGGTASLILFLYLMNKGKENQAYLVFIVGITLSVGLVPFQITTEKPQKSFEVYKDFEVESLPEKISSDKQNFSEKMERELQDVRKQNFN